MSVGEKAGGKGKKFRCLQNYVSEEWGSGIGWLVGWLVMPWDPEHL
jgi:hypothetical protein